MIFPDTCYMIKEPLIIDILMQKQEIRNIMADNEVDQLAENIIEEQTKGFLFERAFVFSFLYRGSGYLQQLDVPDWCKLSSTAKWKQFCYVEAADDISKAAELLWNKRDILSTFHQEPADKTQNFIAAMQENVFLVQHPEIAKGELSPELTSKLAAIMLDNKKVNEMLFFLVKPLDLLVKATKQLGPDVVGFYEFQGERIACCFSMSLRSSNEDNKFESNKEKLDPKYFYSAWRDGSKYHRTILKQHVKGIIQHLVPLKYSHLLERPKRLLGISVTIPWYVLEKPELTADGNQCIIHINEKTLEKFDSLLAKVYLDTKKFK